jgi:hypothetical protein
MLHPGTNTVAVQVSNYWTSWDDVAFDISLKAFPYHPDAPRLSFQFSSAGSQISAATAVGSVWQLQSRDSAALATWQLMETFTNNSGSLYVTRDTGQTNRPASAGRFYRLVPY